jgi:2-isopropylmalate synthase
MNNKNHIKIFDTTLRDGQQCPGAGMSFEDNLKYFELAMGVRMDVVEAGFPSASKVDFEITNTIARQFSAEPDCPIIAGLCQLREAQVDRTIEALLPAVRFQRARMHVYLPVAPALMAASLGEHGEDRAALVMKLYRAVAQAKQAGLEIEFSPEGYSRMGENFDFVTDLIFAAIEAGASVINCPDTIGGGCKYEGASYFVEHMKRHAALVATRFPGREVTWSAHCHDDFGLAVENSINAVFEGPARQIEGCINGIGERAGNAALEQCIMIIKNFAPLGDAEQRLSTRIRSERLKEISDFVAAKMLPRQPHSPITGDNAARHSSGGHTNAVLKQPLAYQPFDPKEVGAEISFLFGPLSGGTHAKAIIEKAGYRCDEAEKASIAQFLKDFYSERRKGITDEELLEGYFEYRKPIRLSAIDYAKSSNRSSVELRGHFFGEEGSFQEAHEGRDSALAALKKLIDRALPGYNVQSHQSTSDREGIDARSLSTIVVSDPEGTLYQGKGLDQDIEISAMKALIDAVNHAYVEKHCKLP